MNTGLDEIIEIRKDMNDDGSVITVTRGLIKFDLTYISSSINSGLISNPTYYLNLYDANSQALNVSQKLYAYPVSQSWTNGSGKAQANPVIEDGASWKWKPNPSLVEIWAASRTLQNTATNKKRRRKKENENKQTNKTKKTKNKNKKPCSAFVG